MKNTAAATTATIYTGEEGTAHVIDLADPAQLAAHGVDLPTLRQEAGRAGDDDLVQTINAILGDR